MEKLTPEEQNKKDKGKKFYTQTTQYIHPQTQETITVTTAYNAKNLKNGIEAEIRANNTTRRITQYVRGVIHGIETIFHPDGITPKIKTPYQKGKIQGVQKIYTKEGYLLKAVPYRRGVISGIAYTYRHNTLKTYKQTTYIRNKKHGIETIYYPNGVSPKLTTPYKCGMKHGIQTLLSQEGNTIRTTEYKRGKRHGTTTIYTESGTIIKQTTYANNTKHGQQQELNPNTGIWTISKFQKGTLIKQRILTPIF